MTLDRSFCMYAINSAIIARVSRLGFRLSDSRHAREIVPTSRVDERAEDRDSGNATPVSGEQSAIFHGILLRARRATVSLADNQSRKFVIAFTRLSGAFCAISQQRELGILASSSTNHCSAELVHGLIETTIQSWTRHYHSRARARMEAARDG